MREAPLPAKGSAAWWFFCAYVALQVLFPIVMLYRAHHEPVRLGWQMFARVWLPQ